MDGEIVYGVIYLRAKMTKADPQVDSPLSDEQRNTTFRWIAVAKQ